MGGRREGEGFRRPKGAGFRVQGSGFRRVQTPQRGWFQVSRFRFQTPKGLVSGFRFQVSGGFRRPKGAGFRFQVSGGFKKFQGSGFRFQEVSGGFRRPKGLVSEGSGT